MHEHLPERLPEPGELVHVRSRKWLVEAVEEPGGSPMVRLACADDDAQGQTLQVFWDYEMDRQILHDKGWSALGDVLPNGARSSATPFERPSQR